jgi:toxin FitB
VIILDTNVLSALMSDPPDAKVLAWTEARAFALFWTTTLTVFEVRLGILNLPDGRRKRALQTAFEEAIETDLERRILAFDESAALSAADLAAQRKKAGRPVDMRDLMIAGIAKDRGAQIATRNVRHFEGFGVKTVNPWDEG